MSEYSKIMCTAKKKSHGEGWSVVGVGSRWSDVGMVLEQDVRAGKARSQG